MSDMISREDAQAEINGLLVAKICRDFAINFREVYPAHILARGVGPEQAFIGLAIKRGHLALPAVQPDAAAIREAALRSTLLDLITEQSEGEWDDKTIAKDVEVFLPRILALIDNPGKEVMPSERPVRVGSTDTAPAGLSAGGGAPVTVQEAARVLLAWPAQRAVFDACSGVVKVYRFNAVLQSLSATEGGA